MTTADQVAVAELAATLKMKPMTLVFMVLAAELDLREALEARCDAIDATDGEREQVRAFVTEHLEPMEARSREPLA